MRNIKNSKVYVGSAVNFGQRKRVHFSSLRKNKGINRHLQNSFDKYGEDNFVFEILEIIDYIEDSVLFNEVLVGKEEFWIKEFNSNNRLLGYNIREKAYSNLGIKWSDETKKKMSIAKKQQIWTEEWKRNISIANKNKKPFTDEAKKNMSEAAKNKPYPSKETRDKLARFGEANPMYGRHHNEEAKQKMAEARAKLTEKEVSQIKTLLLNGLKQQEIAKMFNVTPSNISCIERGVSWKDVEPIIIYKKEHLFANELSEVQVREIKKMLLQHVKQVKIAEIFNITQKVVSDINVGRIWSSVTLENYIDEDNNLIEAI